MSASAYLDALADFLEQHIRPFTIGPTILVAPTDDAGTLEGTIAFPDGCELHVDLTVAHWLDPIDPLESYAFHFQDCAQACVFRFDNSPHHPHLPTHPHHLHEGTQLLPHPRPTGRDVVNKTHSYHQQHV